MAEKALNEIVEIAQKSNLTHKHGAILLRGKTKIASANNSYLLRECKANSCLKWGHFVFTNTHCVDQAC